MISTDSAPCPTPLRGGMRVLAVTNMFPTAHSPTAGTFIEDQIDALRAAGLNIDLLLLDRLRDGMKVYWNVKRRLRPFLDRCAPDLVHVLYGGVMADQVTRSVKRTPIVLTFHGSDLQGEPLSSLPRRILGAYGVAASRRAARRATGIVLVSEHLEKLLPAEVDRRWVRVVPCGISLETFKPIDPWACKKRLGWDGSVFSVLFASNNSNPVKRPKLGRAAVDVLRKQGIPAELKILTGVRKEEVPIWINASDVILLTSFREGSPTIVKEALACNRPVVSVRVGDVESQLAGISGCHLSDPLPTALAEKLARVYLERVPVDGRERIAELSIERTAEKLTEFYFQVLERGAAATDRATA